MTEISNKNTYLRPRDIIDKLKSMQLMSEEKASEFYELNEDSVVSLIQKLIARGFLNEFSLEALAKQLSQGSIDYISKVSQLKGGTSFLQDLAKDLFAESVEDPFRLDKLLTVIYDIDHDDCVIYILTPIYPTEDVYKAIKNFKSNSKLLRQEHSVNIKISDNITTERRTLDNYKIRIKIGQLNLIKNLITTNLETGDILQDGYQQIKKSAEKAGFVLDQKKEVFSFDGTIDENKGSILGQLQYIISSADSKYGSPASDIHFEPYLHTEGGRIRYRVNGELVDSAEAPGIKQYISEIKRLASLNQNEYSIKQDGKISIKFDNTTYLFRVSIMPIGEKDYKQEKAVLRRLSNDTAVLDLVNLKMDRKFRDMLYDMLGDPKNNKIGKYNDGMFLMTGPTGSGKSTTGFAILNHLNTPYVNIITLEDPIEYELPGVNQSNIFHPTGKKNFNETDEQLYSFQEGIEAALRQDPDIIMIGEIRNSLTMDAAQVAASTGHIVLSSLHTNNTWESLNRLIGLGLSVDMIQATIRLIMAQRLAQYTCPHCAKEYNDPIFCKTQDEKALRDSEYMRRKIEVYTSLLETEYINELPDKIEDLKLYEGTGCARCKNTGKIGRAGIYEFLPVDLQIQDFILHHGIKASKTEIRDLFIDKGIVVLFQNALYKVACGIPQEKLIGEDGKVKHYYMNYESAKSAAGGDIYGFGSIYKDLPIEELEKIIYKKKTEAKVKKIVKERDELLYELNGLKKFIGSNSDSESIKKIQLKINELNTIITDLHNKIGKK